MVAVTVDRSGGRNQETLFRLQRTDKRECKDCHDRSGLQASLKRRSMYEGVDVSGLTNTQSSAMTWEFLKRLRDTTKMKIVLKGILAHEDAVLCVGRPYVWGLGAFGQPGVERVLGILRNETRTAMQQLGAPSLKDLTPAMVRRV